MPPIPDQLPSERTSDSTFDMKASHWEACCGGSHGCPSLATKSSQCAIDLGEGYNRVLAQSSMVPLAFFSMRPKRRNSACGPKIRWTPFSWKMARWRSNMVAAGPCEALILVKCSAILATNHVNHTICCSG